MSDLENIFLLKGHNRSDDIEDNIEGQGSTFNISLNSFCQMLRRALLLFHLQFKSHGDH